MNVRWRSLFCERTAGTPNDDERVFLGHLRYATFGKNEEAFCHPFVHTASELRKPKG